MNAKLGAHQNVGRRNRTVTTFPSMLTPPMNPSSVSGWSSSGSLTLASCPFTSSWRICLPRSAPALHRRGNRIVAELLLPPGDVDAIEPSRVLAQDLLLDVQGEGYPELLPEIVGEFEGHELVHDPPGVPDRVIAGKEQPIGADPPEQVGQHLGEVAGTAVNERHDHGQAAIDVGFLDGDPAEILQAGQPAVLDDEVQLGEGGGDFIDVVDLEGVLVEGPDGRPLVHVDVLDPQLLTPFQVAQRPGIGELPPLRIALPLGGIELDARNPVALDQGLQVLQARLAVPGVP